MTNRRSAISRFYRFTGRPSVQVTAVAALGLSLSAFGATASGGISDDHVALIVTIGGAILAFGALLALIGRLVADPAAEKALKRHSDNPEAHANCRIGIQHDEDFKDLNKSLGALQREVAVLGERVNEGIARLMDAVEKGGK